MTTGQAVFAGLTILCVIIALAAKAYQNQETVLHPKIVRSVELYSKLGVAVFGIVFAAITLTRWYL